VFPPIFAHFFNVTARGVQIKPVCIHYFVSNRTRLWLNVYAVNVPPCFFFPLFCPVSCMVLNFVTVVVHPCILACRSMHLNLTVVVSAFHNSKFYEMLF